ncbi:MAG: hypothetical protein AAGI01_08730 [Myxococcota bacterium]
MKDRIKAAEVLAKLQGLMIDKVEATVQAEGPMIVMLPPNGSEPKKWSEANWSRVSHSVRYPSTQKARRGLHAHEMVACERVSPSY